jgi:YidC/Oxa1 family membrane protein insertase
MWDLLIINPMTNALLVLYHFLGNNFVLAIAVFTVLIRLLTLPLNLRQQKSSMRMQAMQPQIQAIQKKYRDNPVKMQEEFRKIGYNPAETLSGCLPLLIQFPILIGLYQAIIALLGSTPHSLFELTDKVYPQVASWIDLASLLPIANRFAWMNLAQPDPILVLPILVAGTMFLQQKLLTPPTPKLTKEQQQENPMAGMQQSMLYTMPLMFGMFSLTFPSGLSIYFILSNIIGIGQGYLMRVGPMKVELPTTAAVSTVTDMSGEAEEEPATGPTSSANGRQGQAAKRKRKRRSPKK